MKKILLLLSSFLVVPLLANAAGFIGDNPLSTYFVVDETGSGKIMASSTEWRLIGLTSDCDIAATSKVLWDATTGQFSCGIDQAAAVSASSTLFSANWLKVGGTASTTLGTDGTIDAASTITSGSNFRAADTGYLFSNGSSNGLTYHSTDFTYVMLNGLEKLQLVGGDTTFQLSTDNATFTGDPEVTGILSLTTGTLCLGADCRTAWPAAGITSYDAFTHPSATVSATTSGLIITASSTIGDGTRGLTVSGIATTSGLVLTNITGSGNRFLFANNVGTVSSVGLPLAYANGGTGTTTGGTPGHLPYFGSTAYLDVATSSLTASTVLVFSGANPTILGTAASISTQGGTFGAGNYIFPSNLTVKGNASTTLFSSYGPAYFGATATSTFTSEGFLGIGSSTPWGPLSIVGNTTPIFVVATSTAAGSLTPVFELDKNGHLITSGAKPVASACGTSPSVTGNDYAGKITTGTGGPTSCTLTFANTYGTAPSCIIAGGPPTANKQFPILISSTTATTLNFVGGATTTNAFVAMTSYVFSYQCIGTQ